VVIGSGRAHLFLTLDKAMEWQIFTHLWLHVGPTFGRVRSSVTAGGILFGRVCCLPVEKICTFGLSSTHPIAAPVPLSPIPSNPRRGSCLPLPHPSRSSSNLSPPPAFSGRPRIGPHQESSGWWPTGEVQPPCASCRLRTSRWWPAGAAPPLPDEQVVAGRSSLATTRHAVARRSRAVTEKIFRLSEICLLFYSISSQI
jgi:hypothetical protein